MTRPPSRALMPAVRDCRGERAPELRAVLEEPFPLLYVDAGSTIDDRPEFVRAASAVRRWGTGRVVIQDDVNVLAVGGLGPHRGLSPVLLPQGNEGRRRFEAALGNKLHKLDLEAALVLPDERLVILGSGSTAAREQLVVVEPTGRVRVRDGRELYARLRGQVAFAGSELNLEGALVTAHNLLLFQRGNGKKSSALQPLNAIGQLPLLDFTRWLDEAGPAPDLTHILRVDLGAHDGVPFGFTDATLQADASIAFLACAEDSLDAVQDGRVLSCLFGILDDHDLAHGAPRATFTTIEHASGRSCTLKLEGIEAHPNESGVFDVVADVDDAATPALGAVLRVGRRGRSAADGDAARPAGDVMR